MRIILYATGGLMILMAVIAVAIHRFILVPAVIFVSRVAQRIRERVMYLELKRKYRS